MFSGGESEIAIQCSCEQQGTKTSCRTGLAAALSVSSRLLLQNGRVVAPQPHRVQNTLRGPIS